MRTTFKASRVRLAILNATVACVLPLAAPGIALAAPKAADPLATLSLEIPTTKIVLKNGLTLIVHEDHSAPLVAFNIYYHVGSKNEPKGKSGFAHLFEHLMFNGSENFNDDFFKATQKIGASDQNGTTWWDRTNYYQTVPKAALETILWLESDRMGHLLGAIDQAKLDEQRSVVKNEKRQGENRPYAKADDLVDRALTPVGHPYDHSTIGSMADLDAASLDDVREWFKTYYGPSNAVLALAGDITPAEAQAKVEKYFGDIAPGTPVSQPKVWTLARTGTVRETAYDRVAQPRIFRTWNISEYASPDTDYLQMLGGVLAGDKNARLYKRLIIDEQLATRVSADVENREIGGRFQIDVTLKDGVDPARVERIVDEELKRLIADGPTPAELGRIRTTSLASFARSLESISSKASTIAESQLYLGSPDAWKASYDRLKSARPADIQLAGRKWLSDGDYVLQILPFGAPTASNIHADRKTMPMPTGVAPATFPAVERATLSNGMRLIVARRAGVPVINMNLQLSTGTPADFASITPGTGPLTMNLLDEATKSRSSVQLVEQLAGLGATVQSGGGGETSSVGLSALKPTLQPALAIFADVVMNPAFTQADIDRLKSQTIASISAAKQDPGQTAGRVMPKLLFGADSAYGRMATEASVSSIDRAQIAAFYGRWFHPSNATLIVAGDTTLAEIQPLIEAAFANWKAGEAPPTIAPTQAATPTQSIVYLIDKPGTPQSVIRASVLAPPRLVGDEVAREALNTALGGSFTSRINMKLREEKGWAYGAGSRIGGGKGVRSFTASASVQSDKTAESMTEISNMLKAVTADQKITVGELATAKDNMSLGLSSDWSTSGGILQYIADQTASGLPDDYYANYPSVISAETLDAVNAAGGSILAGKPLTWVVVGDRSKIEAKIRALNLGEVRIIDADGNLAQ